MIRAFGHASGSSRTGRANDSDGGRANGANVCIGQGGEDMMTDIDPGAVALDAPIPADRIVDVDIYAPPGLEKDFHAAWKALQDGAPPIVWTDRNEGHWIALSGAVLAEVQGDPDRFSNRIIVLPRSVGEKHGLIPTTIDPPEHRPYRKLLNDSLALAKIRNLHTSIRAVAEELIADFAAKGRCDFTNDYARIFPIRIFMSLVDIPMADAERIRFWAECMTRPNPPVPFEDAKQAFYDYLAPIIVQRRASPGEDIISAIVTADMDGRRLTDDEALSLSTQLLIAGVDTVVNFLGFVLLHLARDPDLQARFSGLDRNGMLSATNELFRRFGLVTIARTVREDMDFHGVRLKAGDLVCIPTQVHGLDESINACPMAIDLDRRGARHSAFGSGPHMCPGQELARAEVAITLEQWFRAIPRFRVGADADTRNLGGIVGQIARLTLEWDV